MADIEYDDSLLGTSENLAPIDWENMEGGGKLSVANTPHLCVVKKIKGYQHNFEKYTGPRARRWPGQRQDPTRRHHLAASRGIPGQSESPGTHRLPHGPDRKGIEASRERELESPGRCSSPHYCGG